CLGGLMVATNMDSGHKTVWNAILGVGLALNAGSFLSTAFQPYVPAGGSVTHQDLMFPFTSKEESIDWGNFFGNFTTQLQVYTQEGAVAIMPAAAKLLLLFTAIRVTVQVSLDLISGDKVRYMTMVLLETGAYLFLITNWYGNNGGMNIMGTLMSGFEQLGYTAGGVSDNPNNSILGSGVNMFLGAYNKYDFDAFSPIASLAGMVCLGAILILLVLTGLEMYMARIEFWIMAMITIPLIPFVALPQTRTFFEKALGAMLNLSIKVSVIAFISAMSTGILKKYVDFFATTGEEVVGISFPVLIQALLVSLLLYLIVKKIPNLVQGLLNGTPQLTGATMKQMAGTAAKGGAAVATAGASVGKAMVNGAVSGGFKAAGMAAAGKTPLGTGGASRWAAGAAGALGGGLNAAGGAVARGFGGMAKNALLGSDSSSGGGGGGGRNGGLLAPLRDGARIGNMFSDKKQNGDRQPGLIGMGKNAAESVKGAVMGKDKMKKEVSTNPKTGMPKFDPNTGLAKTHDVESGRHSGLLGNIKDLRSDALDAFDVGAGKKPRSQSSSSTISNTTKEHEQRND
ncbi:MAG: type IV secretion system protein, partial [Selenomonadaceae bacterium]|nr:type IV secretion system protein [Selenomonadaceae bacterium]